MQIVHHFLNKLQRYPQPVAVALGTFDGVHPGHARVLQQVQDAPGMIPAVFTFRDIPAAAMGRHAPRLVTLEEKGRLLEEQGIQTLFLVDFDEIRSMPPEQFVDEVVLEKMHAQKVVCGFNFRFGRDGSGDTQMLKSRCAAAGVPVTVVEPVEVDGEPVSSTRIRACVEEGKMEEAARLLGRRFGYAFEVIHGRQLGRTIGIPTINQRMPDDLICPPFGVYASIVYCAGASYLGVTNIGVKPTVGSDFVTSETWIPSYSGDLYGTYPRVELLSFIRPERRFENLQALQLEILANGEQARKIALQMGLSVL